MDTIILVVDDNPALLEGVKQLLETEGYQVLTALNGVEALKVLERITPDLILADIMMPKMDGYELYERVHEDMDLVQTPFVFLTAKSDADAIRQGKAMGVDDYITKPFDPQDLTAAVQGRLVRMAEVTGQPVPGDVKKYIEYLWHSRIGPVRVQVLVLFAAVLLMTVPLMLALRFLPYRENASELPSSSNAGEGSPAPPVLGMCIIPEGEFMMGGGELGEQQPRQIDLPAFQIDTYEVTNAQYEEFVRETDRAASGNVYSDALADHPVTGVSWEDARSYCEWAGKRLPTEAEWEKAARGSDAFTYPWGDEWRDGLANTLEFDAGSVMPVGSFPDGASPYGVQDMAGNVWEWVDDWNTSAQDTKVIRGGAWNAVQKWAKTFVRNSMLPTHTQDNLGFRCARSE